MPKYKDAINWIALNDDTSFLDDDSSCDSVTAALVADLFGKTPQQVRKDLIKALEIFEHNFSA